MKIETFNISHHGEVKVGAWKDGNLIQHEYYSVPKKVILKLLQAKEAPEIEDFGKWVKESKKSQNSRNRPIEPIDFWHED